MNEKMTLREYIAKKCGEDYKFIADSFKYCINYKVNHKEVLSIAFNDIVNNEIGNIEGYAKCMLIVNRDYEGYAKVIDLLWIVRNNESYSHYLRKQQKAKNR